MRQEPANPPSTIRNPKSSGVALIVTLAMLVLVTIAVMAFFSRATANRGIESSRANQVLANQLARTAEDYVAGEFLREVLDNSEVIESGGGTRSFLPKKDSGGRAIYAVPQRPMAGTAPLNSLAFANLIRRSVSESVNGVGESKASAHSTATASRNGRQIPASRWNEPLLLQGSGFTDNSQLPNWIYLNKDGSATATPGADVIGRFAYIVYNIGGLLDANVAGHPSAVTGTQLQEIKNTVAGADLSVIPGISAPADFLNWRHGPVATSAGPYVAAIKDAERRGFLGAESGWRKLSGRADLIRLARTGAYGFTTEALPFLTSFSRVPDSPAVIPSASRPKVKNQTPALPTFDLDDDFNPPFPSVRVDSAFIRSDGSEARPGEPLVKNKFPLSRLDLFQNAPGLVDQSSEIYKFFGLTRSSLTSPWIYNHGDAGRILRLDEVAALSQGREPDFFELLQAAIPLGSLGKSLGKTAAYRNATGDDVARDVFSKYQILQIGANIIDQWDSDSYPTGVQLLDGNDFTFSGIENLPYLTRIFGNIYISQGPLHGAGDPVKQYLNFFVQPEVWNPHRTANSPPSPSSASPGPDQFRYIIEGSYNFRGNNTFYPGGTFSVSAPRAITFSGSADFAEPRLLGDPHPTRPFHGSASDPRDSVTSPTTGVTFLGTYFGGYPGPGGGQVANVVLPDPSLHYRLQYLRNGVWVTYNSMPFQQMMFYMGGPGLVTNPSVTLGSYPARLRFWVGRSDPRVERFGFIAAENYGDQPLNLPPKPNITIRPAANTSGARVWDFGVNPSPAPPYPGWSMEAPAPIGRAYALRWGSLTGNKPYASDPNLTAYADADGVQRLGDAAYSNGNNGEPMVTGNAASRPVILNRPFRSVAEMGYAGRDLPWKTLDFFTADGADGPLMDVFCLEEREGVSLVSGQVDLNAAPVEVLQALLMQTEIEDGQSLSASQIPTLAQEIRKAVAANPLPDLGALSKNITAAPAVATALTNVQDRAIKRRREVISRALADVSQVRTWNLLADIVVQAGRFPGVAYTEGDFLVDAEQRRWCSFALDRPSATIVNTLTETIHE